jgi:hypothetical protein
MAGATQPISSVVTGAKVRAAGDDFASPDAVRSDSMSRCRHHPLDRHQTVFALGEAQAHLHYLEDRACVTKCLGAMASIAL